MISIEGIHFPEFVRSGYGSLWNELLEVHQNTNPFVTWDWLEIWWENFGIQGNEEILWCRSPRGLLRGGIFTHVVTQTYYGVPLRVLQFWINSHSSRASMFLAGEFEAVAEAVIDYWASQKSRWDIAHLSGIPQEHCWAERLMDAAKRRGIKISIDRSWAHQQLVIDRPWEAYYRAIPRASKHEQERLGRRLLDLGLCTWQKCQGHDLVTQAMEVYMDIEEQSWKEKAGEVIRRDPTLVNFYRGIVNRMAQKDRCEIDLFLLDEQAISSVISLVCGNRLLTLKTSYKEEYNRYSPGWLIFRHLLQDAFSRKFAKVDFYGKRSFLDQWTSDTYSFQDVILFSPTWRGWSALTGKRLKNLFTQVTS